jgi:REP element-mobilizing transposase RayT
MHGLPRRNWIQYSLGYDGADLCEFNGEEHHVHLLVHNPRTVLRERLWSPSYYANPVGGGPLSVGMDYITDQKRPT